MSVDLPTFTLTLPSETRVLSVARAFVESICHAFDFDRRSTNSIVLATGEAVTNILRHAHRDLPEATLTIQVMVEHHTVTVLLHDQGEPFDIDLVPHLEPGELRIGGRGVYMMRRLMDEVASQSCERGNTLRLVKFAEQEMSVRFCG